MTLIRFSNSHTGKTILPKGWKPCDCRLGKVRGKGMLHLRGTATFDKQLWIETEQKATFTAALEAGAISFLFQSDNKHLAEEWRSIAKFEAIFSQNSDEQTPSKEAITIVKISSKEDLTKAEAYANALGTVIMDAADWQIIPAENLVAAFQGRPATLLGVAKTATDARILLEALEIGTDGVVLRTNNPAEVRQAIRYLKETSQLAKHSLELRPAVVKRIIQLGMGDRVAVDLCSLMVPGEGLMVGSFARGLFLVHSECAESQYINSRPFRVNCGPVHSYTAAPGGKTAYLSEIMSGAEVLVVDSTGRQRVAVVGRSKVETRPLVLVEAQLGDDTLSIILQNAETVRLVCPAQTTSPDNQKPAGNRHSLSVTELQEGNEVLVYQQEGARHTGMAIKERILER